jgi:hypothetical protein
LLHSASNGSIHPLAAYTLKADAKLRSHAIHDS